MRRHNGLDGKVNGGMDAGIGRISWLSCLDR
jgi:hypothetical protein